MRPQLRSRSTRPWTGRIAILVVVMVMLGLSPATTAYGAPAEGEPTPDCTWIDVDGDYKCLDKKQGDPGSDGDDGDTGSTPSCDLKDPATFCNSDGWPCYYNDIGPVLPPSGEENPPSPDAKLVRAVCQYEGSWITTDIMWLEPGRVGAPPLLDQALEAIGHIELPVPQPRWSPKGRAYVNLATGFWVEGSGAERRGTSAFGLVALATLRELRVDPGDGSGTVSCVPVPTVDPGGSAGSCRHTYARASVRGPARTAAGEPAFEASMVTVWDLTFINDGVEVTIANAPDTLTSEAGTAAVPVGEIQARVID